MDKKSEFALKHLSKKKRGSRKNGMNTFPFICMKIVWKPIQDAIKQLTLRGCGLKERGQGGKL